METKPYQISDETRKKLRAPFPAEAYQEHAQKSFLTVLKAMYVVERLNDVFGIGRWNLEHEVVSHENDYVLMKGQLKLLDYPDIIVPSQFGGHKTGGTGTERADGYKSAITDCITKSASYLEIGIEVFKGLIKPPKTAKKESEKQNGKNPSAKSSGKTPSGFSDLPWLNQKTKEWETSVEKLKAGTITINNLKTIFRFSESNEKELLKQSEAKPIIKPELLPEMPEWQKAIDYLRADKGAKIEDIEKRYKISKENRESLAFDSI